MITLFSTLLYMLLGGVAYTLIAGAIWNKVLTDI